MRLRRPEPLDRKRHDRGDFDCAEPSVNDWLRRYAGQSRRGNTAATWVIADADDRVVAYASLNTSSVHLSAAPPALRKHAPDPVPTIHCGRLAVDRRCAGLGVGTSLVAHVLATAVDINRSAALKAVTVTALNQRARRWWEGFGFKPFDPAGADCLDMYLLSFDIEATLMRLA